MNNYEILILNSNYNYIIQGDNIVTTINSKKSNEFDIDIFKMNSYTSYKGIKNKYIYRLLLNNKINIFKSSWQSNLKYLKGYVYFMRSIRDIPEGPIKIGETKNIVKRFKEISNMSDGSLEILSLTFGDQNKEYKIHNTFKKYQLYRYTMNELTKNAKKPHNGIRKLEWFRPVNEIIKYANNIGNNISDTEGVIVI